MRPFRPVTPALLVDELAELGYGLRPGGHAIVAVDGAPAADPELLTEKLAAALRERGRATQVVAAADFLRPASVRLEHGHQDPDSFHDDWLDEAALRREVLAPLAPGGSGELLPRLWNPRTDRSYRAERVPLPVPGVLLLHGPLLLGRGLPVDLAVHLALSPGALARRTPPDEHWTLPAFARYAAEVDPESTADVVVRCDDPARPAVSAGPATAGPATA